MANVLMIAALVMIKEENIVLNQTTPASERDMITIMNPK